MKIQVPHKFIPFLTLISVERNVICISGKGHTRGLGREKNSSWQAMNGYFLNSALSFRSICRKSEHFSWLLRGKIDKRKPTS